MASFTLTIDENVVYYILFTIIVAVLISYVMKEQEMAKKLKQEMAKKLKEMAKKLKEMELKLKEQRFKIKEQRFKIKAMQQDDVVNNNNIIKIFI